MGERREWVKRHETGTGIIIVRKTAAAAAARLYIKTKQEARN